MNGARIGKTGIADVHSQILKARQVGNPGWFVVAVGGINLHFVGVLTGRKKHRTHAANILVYALPYKDFIAFDRQERFARLCPIAIMRKRETTCRTGRDAENRFR